MFVMFFNDIQTYIFLFVKNKSIQYHFSRRIQKSQSQLVKPSILLKLDFLSGAKTVPRTVSTYRGPNLEASQVFNLRVFLNKNHIVLSKLMVLKLGTMIFEFLVKNIIEDRFLNSGGAFSANSHFGGRNDLGNTYIKT